jgi:hypothetical protein
MFHRPSCLCRGCLQLETESTGRIPDDLAKGIVWLVEKLGPPGAEIVKGVYSTPWTAIPFTIAILSQIDPTGKLTTQFLGNLYTFISALADAFGKALAAGLANLGRGLSNLPTENPVGLHCVRIVSIGGVESHKCYDTIDARDRALAQLKSEDFLHLQNITAYDLQPPTVTSPLFCVKYTGFLNTPGNQCFTTAQARADFIRIGVGSRRIANPQTYEVTQ